MKKEVPEELDWVKVRSTCSLSKVFVALCDGVKIDVKVMNELRGDAPRPFEVGGETTDTFTVRRQEQLKPAVQFALEPGYILIAEVRFTVGLNDEGRCILRNDGKEYEQWQVRKMALENLFFPTN